MEQENKYPLEIIHEPIRASESPQPDREWVEWRNNTQLVSAKTQAGEMCEAVLRTIFPMRELFTRAQFSDAGYFIRRIGFDKTCQIADWAKRKVSIKDGRYEAWMRTCRKEIGSQREQL